MQVKVSLRVSLKSSGLLASFVCFFWELSDRWNKSPSFFESQEFTRFWVNSPCFCSAQDLFFGCLVVLRVGHQPNKSLENAQRGSRIFLRSLENIQNNPQKEPTGVLVRQKKRKSPEKQHQTRFFVTFATELLQKFPSYHPRFLQSGLEKKLVSAACAVFCGDFFISLVHLMLGLKRLKDLSFQMQFSETKLFKFEQFLHGLLAKWVKTSKFNHVSKNILVSRLMSPTVQFFCSQSKRSLLIVLSLKIALVLGLVVFWGWC